MRVFKLTARTASGSETIVWEHANTMAEALTSFATRNGAINNYTMSVSIVMERNVCNVQKAFGNCKICVPVLD